MVNFSEELSDRAPVFLNKQLEGLYKKIKKNPKDYISQRQYAEILLERPNKERALRAMQSLEIILSEKDEDIDSQILYLITLRYLEKMKKAKNLAERLIEKYPNTVGFHVELIQILQIENKIDQAETLLERALKKFHDDEKLVRCNIRLQSYLKKWEESLSLCNIALDSHPKDQRIVKYRCVALFNLDRVDEAILFLEKFKENHPHQFNLPMWSMDNEYQSCSATYALFCKIAGRRKSPEHEDVIHENGQLFMSSNLTEDSKNLLEKAIDETTEILSNTDHHASQNGIKVLQAECYRLLEKFEESRIIFEEIPSEYDFRNTGIAKIRTLFLGREFQKCIEFCSTYLDSFPDNSFVKRTVPFSYLGLGNTSEFKKRMSEIKVVTKNEYNGAHLREDEYFTNHKAYLKMFESFSGLVRIKNQYIKKDIIEYIVEALDNSECKITDVQIIGGVFDRDDGGSQFFTAHNFLRKAIQKFNKQFKDKHQILCRIKMESDKYHARYYIDDSSCYHAPGTDQIKQGDVDDILPVSPKTADELRESFDSTWNTLKGFTLSHEEKKWKKLLKNYEKCYEGEDAICDKIQNALNSGENKKS